MNSDELWRIRGEWGSSNGGYAEGGKPVGRKPGNPSPFDMGGVPNRPRRPRKSSDKGCAVMALAMAGGVTAGLGGIVYGAVQAAQAVL